MSSTWSTVACIAVTTATAGFAIGYLATPDRAPQAADPQWPQAAADGQRTPALEPPGLQLPTPADSGHGEQLVYYPETILADAEALAPGSSSSANPSEPGILPDPSSTATPLPRSNAERSALGQLIESEFGPQSEQELEVWLDVLGGLPLEDAAGILRIWRQFGRGPSGPGVFAADPLTPPLPRMDTPAAAAPDSDSAHPALVAINLVRERVVHNLLNAESHGYRRQEPLLSDTASRPEAGARSMPELASTDGDGQPPAGVMLDGWRIDQRPGTIRQTGNSLDVAISGQGFFIVRRGGDTLYTRCGRFRTDDQGRLVLDQPDAGAVLQPEVVVPADANEIFISPEGDVRAVRYGEEPESIGRLELATFRDASRLHPVGGTLFRESESSGPADRSAPHTAQTGWLQQRALESSNVELDVELSRLEWLNQLAREVARGTTRP